MIRLFLSLTIISIVIVSIWCSDGYTAHNSLLRGHVFKTIESINWLKCVEECHKHHMCIFYNYFPPEKVCELNNFGYDNQCEVGNNLIRATGWIHHVLDISEVNYTCKYVDIYCTIGRKEHYYALHLGESTKKKINKKRISFSSCH